MTKQERYQAFLKYLVLQPIATTELQYTTPFQLLIAVMLSAQCTDKRVNMVTPALFQAFPTPIHLAYSSFEEVYPYIKSISYPNNKTKYLIEMAKTLVETFNSKVPECVEDLQKLAGIGRKSAHVIGALLYNTPTMPVDTHVMRVSKRLGLVSQQSTTPLAIEKELVQHIPPEHIGKVHHWLVLHGRYICMARKPQCNLCELTKFCKFYVKGLL
jgi:endonuclease-3